MSNVRRFSNGVLEAHPMAWIRRQYAKTEGA
jgi:hypothetical protein